MTHNLHFVLINADEATEAASEAKSLIPDWCDDDIECCVGGIASEDGSDDVENHDEGGWGLSFLNSEEGITKEGTCFSRAVAYLHKVITGPVRLTTPPYSLLPDHRSAIIVLCDVLRAFYPEHSNPYELREIVYNLNHLFELIKSRREIEKGFDIPQVHEWHFENFGVTDLTDQSTGAKRYLLFLDMHS